MVLALLVVVLVLLVLLLPCCILLLLLTSSSTDKVLALRALAARCGGEALVLAMSGAC